MIIHTGVDASHTTKVAFFRRNSGKLRKYATVFDVDKGRKAAIGYIGKLSRGWVVNDHVMLQAGDRHFGSHFMHMHKYIDISMNYYAYHKDMMSA
jgi:hypothetical protein